MDFFQHICRSASQNYRYNKLVRWNIIKKVQVGNDPEMVQSESEKKIPL